MPTTYPPASSSTLTLSSPPAHFSRYEYMIHACPPWMTLEAKEQIFTKLTALDIIMFDVCLPQ
ncbi:hypothetical protein DACRYDRAFT_108118 [Dacryopinax primogenitus]|uniref:Uncharacterized protein n=1 Tax=Dacryopinax primogenitus (strain DJM 731) TaxID=1858805 RepID=M5G0A8_DACPD|nr:uncharacterized protein DACRYDRAFT_108118 [Dacryopinax primogenitus]EJU01580.1 hypothetical protein DACRYDRAFT_108118 [Dacryopinax primogenitus]